MSDKADFLREYINLQTLQDERLRLPSWTHGRAPQNGRRKPMVSNNFFS